MAGRILYPGETVEASDDVVRCSRDVGGRPCTGVLGWPPAGSQLIERFDLEAGEYLSGCHPQVTGFKCDQCGAVAVFRSEST